MADKSHFSYRNDPLLFKRTTRSTKIYLIVISETVVVSEMWMGIQSEIFIDSSIDDPSLDTYMWWFLSNLEWMHSFHGYICTQIINMCSTLNSPDTTISSQLTFSSLVTSRLFRTSWWNAVIYQTLLCELPNMCLVLFYWPGCPIPMDTDKTCD